MAADPLRPTLEQVGALMFARTRDSEGVEQGSFTADTRPTASQANAIIDMAVDAVRAVVGSVPEDSRCAQSAYMVAALGAARMIEKSLFPEQVNTPRSPYESYRVEYEEALTGLAGCLGVPVSGSAGSTVTREWGQIPVAITGLHLPAEHRHAKPHQVG